MDLRLRLRRRQSIGMGATWRLRLEVSLNVADSDRQIPQPRLPASTGTAGGTPDVSRPNRCVAGF